MAEVPIALNGLNQHRQFQRSVIPILVYDLKENPNSPSNVVSGIVTVSGEGFCHIIAYKGLLITQEPHRFSYDVVFPNNMRVDLESLVVERNGLLAHFYCPVPVGTVDAVQFGNQTTKNQKLKMYGYQIDLEAEQIQNDLTDGYVTHVEDKNFGHDCPPSLFSKRGSPVFNMEGQLVGISYKDFGVTKAFDIKYITSTLSRLWEGMDNMPMSEILHRIRKVGEEKFPPTEDQEPSPSP